MTVNADHPVRQIPSLAMEIIRLSDDTRPEHGALSPMRAQRVALDALYRGYQAGRTDAIMELMTTEQMAAELNVTVRRVQAIAERRGVGWRIGRDWLFRPEDIEAMRPGPPGRPRRDGA